MDDMPLICAKLLARLLAGNVINPWFSVIHSQCGF